MAESPYQLSYPECRDLLRRRLAEPAPGRVQLLAGPRQVGKTTLLLELAGSLGAAAIYLAADGPEAALPGAWERLWTRAEDLGRTHGCVVVLLDEVRHLHDWAARLKVRCSPPSTLAAFPTHLWNRPASGRGSRTRAWRTPGTQANRSRTGAKSLSTSTAFLMGVGASGPSK